ncbi:MAG: RnfABCDGE type electron transport complex subunit B [Verrucomicrobia bacterium]|mgnify:CR=1 FL=1|jgi:Na+-translocating ferredoxin:NAD+ oxidoreductase subunit B|nr:RnfABCDGE type electron transport complex subunit B [Verrucomicrobiota bacterium]MBT7064804.1 RnfABCDGE type electron transport complex subunit B [Verrucomicrobiota bacterium]
MTPILTTALTIGGAGLACGGLLALAAKFLAVKEDPRIEEINGILPGANCGGCGYAGCAAYAEAVLLKGAPINLCAPGGAEVLGHLADITGETAKVAEHKVAVVLCGGDVSHAPRKFDYNGVADCRAAHATGGGDKSCSFGCLGYASCSHACPVGAIEMVNGIAKVHRDLCISCGSCIRTCPRHLIKMVPYARTIHVMCSSKDKGPAVKKACKVGCIGCTICTKLAENESIKMAGFLAVVDYEKDLDSDAVIEKCPGKCIVRI